MWIYWTGCPVLSDANIQVSGPTVANLSSTGLMCAVFRDSFIPSGKRWISMLARAGERHMEKDSIRIAQMAPSSRKEGGATPE